MTLKYFNNCTTIEDVKEMYKKLAKALHPDCNPDKDTTKDFQELQAEFVTVSKMLQNKHRTEAGQAREDSRTEEQKAAETPELFMAIINQLIKMEGLNIELVGCWIWVDGNTYGYREQLKELGFKWSKSRQKWHFNFDGDFRRWRKRGKQETFESIQSRYGSTSFGAVKTARLA